MPTESANQDHSDHPETQGPASPAARLLPASPVAQSAAPHALEVPIAQLDQWRADVAEQRQVVKLALAILNRAGETLEQCSAGGAGWGELRRKPRYLQHQLDVETDRLDQ